MNKGLRKIFVLILLAVLHTLLITQVKAQSYGLGFASHEVNQDKRTSVELLPAKDFCTGTDFELAFDISLLPGRRDLFGYILRIVKNEKDYIDLLYDVRPEGNQFRLVIGGNFTNIAFAIDSASLFGQWNHFRLQFDLKHDRLQLHDGKHTYTQEKLGLKTGDCYKFFLGASLYRQHKVTDVPPMKIRDIKLTNGGAVKYHWPLDEREGNTGLETQKGANATVNNPVWIKNTHYEWKLLRQLTVRRAPSFAFNPAQEILYVVGADSLYNITSTSGEVNASAYLSGQQTLLRGNQSLYVNNTGALYNIYLDHNFITTYSFAKKDWEQHYQAGPVTDYWHFNKFYCQFDTSIYVLNGYGHFRYRDTIRRYHLPTKTWSRIATTGDRLLPRYLAAAAPAANGKGLYILGGYGSESGQQILAPKSYYDLVYFDAEHHTFKKLLEIKPGKEDVVFANSFVVDEKANTWYGLVYPNYRYSSRLQLLKGSLDKPGYEVVGDSISYSFRDVNSFSDLYYCPRSKQLLALTSLQATPDNNGTYNINIYTLAAPPIGPGTLVITSQSDKWPWWSWGVVAAVFTTIAALLYSKRKRKAVSKVQAAPIVANNSQQQIGTSPNPVTTGPVPATPTQQPAPTASTTQLPEAPLTKAIYLFGEMQVLGQDGADITKQFTPLLKELFLIILLHSFRKGRGVHSDKLTELLWFDKPAQSARNNRSVNIAKLKAILEKLPGCQVSNETGAWKIEITDPSIYLDYQHYLQIVQHKTALTRDKINQLASITGRGGFLSQLEYPWIASYKAEVSNDIIDTYLNFAGTIPVSQDAEFLVKLAGDIFHFDPVNEDAMTIQCKALVYQGKHSLAKKAFENFAREYKTLYGEDFKHDFHTIIGE
ncbi:hypothetical protein [Paraflavitalea sp. CAU 1676]|uniref:hypothetical protein n=1 Tax=Paraflavitalea sp. CAU 1676 TaxID=3032598 RepID=UPI0023DAFAE5|nr:hypothetical protein [Paraflavitalea sp. CAU 1676]MDF2192395.1 hypothetical protein [Paraflavitalea sp. CAU 1676]